MHAEGSLLGEAEHPNFVFKGLCMTSRLRLFSRRKSPRIALPDAIEAALPIERATAVKSADSAVTQALDLFEQDVLRISSALSRESSDAAAHLGQSITRLDAVKTAIDRLRRHSESVSDQVAGVSQSTDLLAGAASEIVGTIERVHRCSASAQDRAEASTRDFQSLGEAVREIGSQLNAIGEIASRTNLLALNATIEAARAGEAGRGFSVVAQEVKALSVASAQAVSGIRERMAALEAVTQHAISGMTGISADISELAPICAGISDAVQEQRTTIDSLRQQMENAQVAVVGVAREVSSIAEVAAEARQNSLDANEISRQAAGEASQLGRRVVTVLRSMPVANRRQHERYPIDLALRIRQGGSTLSAHSFDVSEGGMLIRSVEGFAPAVGTVLDVEATRLGSVRLKVVNVSSLGIHCAFADPPAMLLEAVGREIGSFRELHQPLVERAVNFAAEITEAIEGELKSGKLSMPALFDVNYRPIAGTDPVQYESQYLSCLDAVLPPILEKALSADSRMVFALAIDRNGYIPVHNRKFSQPQRPGDRAWNIANCRNRRIFDDRAGLLAGRVIHDSLIQTYNRDMGNGVTVQMKEVDAPIRIRGQHWGGVRMAYRL
ncbi:MAG: PilZ domain-containing protein [Methylobacterium sp.]|nr:PilZ domain-containing protein [Methylobacterium sp.]MCA3619213.1 PilZ domain-containing protein [Methylobacterium sp.]MCA3620325.1 PilZ domain-containing protein [Methylobacterium sp.]